MNSSLPAACISRLPNKGFAFDAMRILRAMHGAERRSAASSILPVFPGGMPENDDPHGTVGTVTESVPRSA